MNVAAAGDVLLLRPSRWRWLLMLAISVVFFVIGVVLFGRHPWGGGVCLVFFGACIVVGILQLVPGASHLRLDTQGFDLRSLYRSHHFAWRDISGFGTMQVALRSMVGWNFVAGYGGHGRLRQINVGVSGFEAALPDTYGHSAAELAAIMETWRVRASTAVSQSPAGT